MKRSTGVTLSAVLVFIGSVFTLLLGVLAALGTAMVHGPQMQSAALHYFLYGIYAVYIAFAIWGIASGVGLLLLREWARISMIVFSALLLVFMLPGLLFFLLTPMATPANVPANVMLFIKLGVGLFEGSLAALGAVWLYFFTRKKVRTQFRGETTDDLTASGSSKRPLSISIIAWILIVSGICGGLGAVLLMALQFPMFLGGYVVTGARASVVIAVWCVTEFCAGVGLLRLKSWGWVLAVVTLSAGALNGLSMVLIPGSETRFREAMELMIQRLGLPAQGVQVPSSAWFGIIFGFVFVGVQLWFLIARRNAFYPRSAAPSSLG